MKINQTFLLFFNFILLISCSNKSTSKNLDENIDVNTIKIIDFKVDKKELRLDQNKGVWFYQNVPFNGFAISYFDNNQLKEKTGFYNGKRQGIVKKWFSSGNIKLEYFYNQNRIEGLYKSWWDNGQKSSELIYTNGVQNGIEKKWYPSGKIAKIRNVLNGKENGLQKAWLENGKLYVNYEAKNGRVYGLRRANKCYQLKNEKLVEYVKK
ncbi:toxin-antitoxin system YwqK family antitoxin [Lutibacter sp. Hel_I_33_5]|uniref:toxin-antitoxin system YwqK family antitoxin n=1 Tax=Lutibacter sp. Hel_I_33_5 TaxID=1566289 RepID=UPI0011A13AF6|nr:toxin-antitoxin system YwqK family antitoxin [Lutibacter sp. Hel_I_33_5]